ncbi:retrovirus-related Pol polyprotein from transposon TNT 1-94 [Trichonephila clavipes]|nr:retrovirus-related Pol polyprotein from transposon TNT 1-94 [Trichonephila clavipes]
MKYKDILLNWVVDLEEKSQVEEVNYIIHVKSSVVNLPKLEVPHFYGNCENWISFKELFKPSILDNKSISDLEKLQYLQASVREDAAKLIRGFAITLDNLKNCLDILCSRQRWELSLENKKIPTLEDFRVLIEREARGLNELKFVKPAIKKGNVKPLNSFNKSNANTTVVKCNQVKSCVRPDVVEVSPSSDTQANSVVTVSNNCTQSAEGHVLLSTVLINVKSKYGQQITCCALIDNASQNSLISKQCADRLKLPLKHTNHKFVGEQYTEFMEEHQNLGHMTPLASDVKSPHYFLPHHVVINDNSSTTKLRVVFDGSFKSTKGNSLNDILLTGKKLHLELFFMKSVASTLNRVTDMEFNNQISVLTPNNWNTWKHDMQVLLMHYGCWQFIIQTKPEQPDEEATYKKKLDLQLQEDFRVVKIEAELILEANRLQLMKQDLEKAENAYLSSFTLKKSKTLPGATAAAHGNPNGKNDYQEKRCRIIILYQRVKKLVFSDVTAKTKNGSIEIRHQRFCHVNNDYLVKTSKNDSVKGLPRLTDNGKAHCIPCKLAKSKRVSFKKTGAVRSKRPLELLHMDLCGPMPTESQGGNKYFLSIIDDYSRKVTVFPIRNKSDVFHTFIRFQKRAERFLSKR